MGSYHKVRENYVIKFSSKNFSYQLQHHFRHSRQKHYMDGVHFKAYQQDQGADENTYGLDADIWQKFRSCQGSHSFAPGV